MNKRSALVGVLFGVGTAIDPAELANHAATASDFLSSANFLAKFVYSGLTKSYQLYRYLRDTETVNTVAIVVGTLLAVYIVLEVVRMLLRELFGLRRSFNVDITQSSEVKDLNEQLRTIQKEMRDIGRTLRMQKEQEKKLQANPSKA